MVFKRNVPWYHRIIDCHFVYKELGNLSQKLHLHLVYAYIYLCIDMQIRVVITECNDDFELLHVSSCFLLSWYKTAWTVEKSQNRHRFWVTN
jgi:hypothetical protein